VLIGIDTGGTFTDLVGYDAATDEVTLTKVPSTPHDPAEAVVLALSSLGERVSTIERVVLGTTIAINAILQRRGADVVYLTTAGFEDVPYIQRISRPHLYDLQWKKGDPLVRRSRTIGVRERIDHRGDVIEALADSELERVAREVERLVTTIAEPAVAISLLFSYVNPVHEQRLEEALRARMPNVAISLSSHVAPVWREYERGSTTIADAYVRPLLTRFAGSLVAGLRAAGVVAPISLMKSNGGQVPAHVASEHASELVLSGLAGGLLAGKYYSDLLRQPAVITLDMGGTSADVGVIVDGEISFRESYDIEWAIPIVGSFVDMTSIGAGGSSIAGFDRGGFLKVGPESAAAEPGPAAYGRDGTDATVTDANLVLGRLDPDYFLGGQMPLYPELARAAVARVADRLGSSLEDGALAIVRMANENMANAVRLLTVDRGLDHRQFDLLAFGGAGPVHAAELATALGMQRVLVPPHPGLASAFALGFAEPRVDRRRTYGFDSESARGDELQSAFDELTADALGELARDQYEGPRQLVRTVRMRYAGQNYEQEIAVPDRELGDVAIAELVERFHARHEAFYGYAMRDAVCEFTQLNVTVVGEVKPPAVRRPALAEAGQPAKVRPVYFGSEGWIDTAIWFRNALGAGAVVDGPAVVQELDSTTIVHPDQRLVVEEHGIMTVETVRVAEPAR
jgi:N-methylhydantoinase A